MKRVKILLTVVCMVVVMSGLTSGAAAWGVDSYVYFNCSYCGDFSARRVTSFRSASSASSGLITVFCGNCSKEETRVTKYWGTNFPSDFSGFGVGDIIRISCSFSGKMEDVCIYYISLPVCNVSGRVQGIHLGNGCSKAYSSYIPALGHSYTETSRTPATCLPGSVSYQCSRCDETKTEPLPADPNAHAWSETSRTPATCLPGSVSYRCSRCDETKTESLPADPNAHTWAETSRTPATCLPGAVEYTCSTCQETKSEPIPALPDAHTYSVSEVIPATYDAEGNLVSQSYIRYSCSVCGNSYNSVIGGGPAGPVIEEGAGGNGMRDSTAAFGKTFLDGLWALFGIYVPGFSFTFGQMWLGVLLASISILVVRMIFGFGGGGPRGDSPRTSSTNNPRISKERRNDEF